MENNSILLKARSHHPRTFKDFIFAYPVLSRRARGVSIGINLNLDKKCNFNCSYCQVHRKIPGSRIKLSINAIISEVKVLLDSFNKHGICRLQIFKDIPNRKKILRDIAISGDGEPTLFPGFARLCRALYTMQLNSSQDFKLVLITNSTRLDRPVLEGIGYLLKHEGEVWAKLDSGSQSWYKKINAGKMSLEKIEKNLIKAGKKFPLIIQTMLVKYQGHLPSKSELSLYCRRLRRILKAGASIRKIQLYTINRPSAHNYCQPVSRKFLTEAGRQIRDAVGIEVKVY
jgi:wyosine [tRNA(Phe)-imidazoG37] synthetase (radical SAM superfamily)